MNLTLTDHLEETDLAAAAGCEFRHGNPSLCAECAGDAAYRVITRCTGGGVNWCANVYKWYQVIIRNGVGCSECLHLVRDCWTVFPI